jgi:sugar lactone lactonase YvrE
VRSLDISVPLGSRDQLGESPVWDERRGELLRVDIARGLVHAWRPADGGTHVRSMNGEVGAVVLRECGEGLIAAVGHEIRLLGDDGSRALTTVPARDNTRLNDCRCDPQGRLWAGTMARDRAPGTAALYRLTAGEDPERVLERVTISNGIGWSPAGDSMYYVDSTTQRIDTFDFDGATGRLGNRRALARIDPADGLPDGLAVDAEGGVWVCLFGGGVVRRYGSDGTLGAEIGLPVTNPTCPTFGGPGLTTLYVTSARHRLTPHQLADEPLAGALLALDPGVGGLPAARYAG